ITERTVKSAMPEPSRNVIIYDDEISMFGLRVTSAGGKSFVLTYYIAGRQRRITIGSWPDWSVAAARQRAKELKRGIDNGDDPLSQRTDAREASTISDLIGRYLNEHTIALAERSRSDQTSIMRKMVEPEWGSLKVAGITPDDVDRLLAKIAK